MPFELPLPRVRLSFADYNLGLTPPLTDAHAKIGVAWDGPMTPQRVTSGREVADLYRGGPLANAAAVALLQTAPVILQRAPASIGGALGDQGATPIPPNNYVPQGTLFFTGSPNGDYRIEVEFTRFDSAGPTALRYSINDTQSDEVAVNAPGESVPLGNTGVLVSTQDAREKTLYWVNAQGPAATLPDMVGALTALLDTRPALRFVHIVGAATPELVAAVDAILAEREARAYYAHAVLEAPARGSAVQGGGEVGAAMVPALPQSMGAYLADMQRLYAGVLSTRVSVALDGGPMYNPLTKRVENHNSAWKATAVRPTRPVGEAPYRTRSGPMIGMTGELAFDAGLVGSSGRFLALRTFDALSGIYVAHWPTLAPQGSDYNEVQRREVADQAARAGYAAALAYLGDDLRVDLATGRILETEAQAFEAFVAGRVQSALGANVSGVRIRLNREENILSTEHIEFTVSIIPLGYLKYIDVTVGFENPYLSAAMAAPETAPVPTPDAPTSPPSGDPVILV